jgi:hypothetical protein
MVQVDVFWAYGWGASLAVAAGRQLAATKKPFETKFFVWTLLFLSLFWAPTGMLLLIRHPSWETMQAAENFLAMSEWIVLAFGITNITQGILGFWVGRQLMLHGKYYMAQLNWILGYFGMFFILLYGWDGLGYDRFLYDRDMYPGSPAWEAGVGTAGGVLAAIVAFLTSSVAITLYIDGLWLLPPFLILALAWFRKDAQLALGENGPIPSRGKLVLTYFAGVFAVGFASAAFTALTVRGVAYGLGVGEHVARGLGELPANTGMHVASYIVGIPLALTVLWFLFLKPGRPAHHLLRPLWLTPDGTPPRLQNTVAADPAR